MRRLSIGRCGFPVYGLIPSASLIRSPRVAVGGGGHCAIPECGRARGYVWPALATLGAGWFAHVTVANATTSLARWFSPVGWLVMVAAVCWRQVLHPSPVRPIKPAYAEQVLMVLSATVAIAALAAFAAWLVRHLNG